MSHLCHLRTNFASWTLRALAMVALAGGFLLYSSPVEAQALVIVKVRASGDQTVDGKVSLQTKDGKSSYSCQTSGGTCKIENVGGGLHVVTFTPQKGAASKPRNVMIPPQGKVTLFVAPGRTE